MILFFLGERKRETEIPGVILFYLGEGKREMEIPHGEPKEVCGLGVINTKIMNWCLMTKWAWKILTGRGGLWLDIFRRKYLEDGGVEFRRNAKLSQFARDVKKVQPLLRLGMKFTVHNGKPTCFCLDIWCDDNASRMFFRPFSQWRRTRLPRWQSVGDRDNGSRGFGDL